MVAVSNIPYTVSIDEIDTYYLEQRVQLQHGTRVYDICWDIAKKRVVTYYDTEQGETLWLEIRRDDTTPLHINLLNVLCALDCISEDTQPILTFSEYPCVTLENYLHTPISATFIIQIDVVPVSNNIQSALDDPSHT